jgi:hypothetical protein
MMKYSGGYSEREGEGGLILRTFRAQLGDLLISSPILPRIIIAIFVLSVSIVGCTLSDLDPDPGTDPDFVARPTTTVGPAPAIPDVDIAPEDVWQLWTSGTQLRGVNIYQRRVYEELDGIDFMGYGDVGPPYEQGDFDQLAAMGANYVNISHPGLFTEEAPFEVDPGVVANLDNLLGMIQQADMFAVISFRTGPGRSEFTFMLDEAGTWFDRSYMNDTVWTSADAQEGWIDMWGYAAERYRGHPIVVGFDLMVEPNANEAAVEIWDADTFYDLHAGTLLDWNQLHPRISREIREVDANTPILVGGMSYSALDWLSHLEPTDDSRTIYTFHQYAPYQYTHQEWGSRMLAYPGEFDTDWDGIDDVVDAGWLREFLTIVDDFRTEHGYPLAVNEYGVVRWIPGAARFMDDQMALFEEKGLNYALWVWEVSWEPFAEEVHAFNFRFGADPDNREDLASSDLIDVLMAYWSRNSLRPSSFAREP